jgi:hypothetical protein
MNSGRYHAIQDSLNSRWILFELSFIFLFCQNLHFGLQKCFPLVPPWRSDVSAINGRVKQNWHNHTRDDSHTWSSNEKGELTYFCQCDSKSFNNWSTQNLTSYELLLIKDVETTLTLRLSIALFFRSIISLWVCPSWERLWSTCGLSLTIFSFYMVFWSKSVVSVSQDVTWSVLLVKSVKSVLIVVSFLLIQTRLKTGDCASRYLIVRFISDLQIENTCCSFVVFVFQFHCLIS